MLNVQRFGQLEDAFRHFRRLFIGLAAAHVVRTQPGSTSATAIPSGKRSVAGPCINLFTVAFEAR